MGSSKPDRARGVDRHCDRPALNGASWAGKALMFCRWRPSASPQRCIRAGAWDGGAAYWPGVFPSTRPGGSMPPGKMRRRTISMGAPQQLHTADFCTITAHIAAGHAVRLNDVAASARRHAAGSSPRRWVLGIPVEPVRVMSSSSCTARGAEHLAGRTGPQGPSLRQSQTVLRTVCVRAQPQVRTRTVCAQTPHLP